MAGGWFVEGGAENVTVERSAQVGDFLGSFIHKQEHEVDIGMICLDGKGKALEHHGLSDPGRSHDQSPLSHAERSDQVDRPGRGIGLARLLQVDAPVGKHGGEFVELQRGLPFAGRDAFDGRDRLEAEAALRLQADDSCNAESGAEFVLAEQGDGKGEIRRGGLEVEEGPPDHRGIRSEFQDAFRSEDTSPLDLVPGDIKNKMMFGGVAVDGELPLLRHCEKPLMTQTVECTQVERSGRLGCGGLR